MLVALVRSCHPGPTVAVTLIAGLLALSAGAGPGGVLWVAAAVLAGQLSIGWCNDWVDAARDAAVDRRDKPAATGAISRTAVGAAAGVALAAAVPLSLALGVRAGSLHLVAVGAGWSYNLGLKASVWSWAPYAGFFGALPAVVSLSLPGHPWPPVWAVGAGALLGVGAHLANVLPDLEDDAGTGVRGLPHRLGRTGSSLLAPLLLMLASVLVVAAPGGASGAVAAAVLALTGGLAVAGAAVALTRPRSRLPFLATVAIALVDVALLVYAGVRLS